MTPIAIKLCFLLSRKLKFRKKKEFCLMFFFFFFLFFFFFFFFLVLKMQTNVYSMPIASAMMSTREPLKVMNHAPFVRVVAFGWSGSDVMSVTTRFDDSDTVHTLTRSPTIEHTFTSPWQPSQYSSGIHVMHVTVTNADGEVIYLLFIFFHCSNSQSTNRLLNMIIDFRWMEQKNFWVLDWFECCVGKI